MSTNGTVAKSVNTNIINTKTLNRKYLSFHAFMVNKESVTLEVRSKLVKNYFPWARSLQIELPFSRNIFNNCNGLTQSNM